MSNKRQRSNNPITCTTLPCLTLKAALQRIPAAMQPCTAASFLLSQRDSAQRERQTSKAFR